MKISADIRKAVQPFARIVKIIDFRKNLRIKNPVDQLVFITEMVIKSVPAYVAVFRNIFYRYFC